MQQQHSCSSSIHRRQSLPFLRVCRGPAFKNARPTHKTKWRISAISIYSCSLSLDTSTTLVVFNYAVRSDVMEAIIPAHELLPLGRIKRLINNADKNVALARGADGNPLMNVAIVVGAIDERHNAYSREGFGASQAT